MNREEHDKEPVYYCLRCLSLKIRGTEDLDYCDECGSTDIAVDDIHHWERLYKEKYGHSFIKNK